MIVFVGLAITIPVFVIDAMAVGVGILNDVGVVFEVTKDVLVVVGNDVLVINEALGVRNTLIQAGLVRMEMSMGSTNPLGLRVRKSLFGSRLDSILVSNFQLGEKRSAHCPAKITHRNPNKRMTTITIQSRRSCSAAFICESIDRQSYEDSSAGICIFVVSEAFKPDAPLVGVHDTA